METTRYQVIQSLYAVNNALTSGLISNSRSHAICAQIALTTNLEFNLPLDEKDRKRIVSSLEDAIATTDNQYAIGHLNMALAQLPRLCYICEQVVTEGSDKCAACHDCFIPVQGNGVRPPGNNFWE